MDDANYQRALAYFQRGETSKAHQCIINEQEVRQHHELHLKGAICLRYGVENDNSEALHTAINNIQEAISQCAKPEYEMNLASCYQATGQLSKAEQIFINLYSRYPQNVNIIYNYANCCKAQQNYELALTLYDKVLGLNPQNAGAVLNKGLCLYEAGRFTQAKDYFQQFLYSDPNNVEFLLNLAANYFALKDYKQSLNTYEKILSIQPNNPYASWNKCLILLLQGNYSRGWPEYEKRWQWPENESIKYEYPLPLWQGGVLNPNQKLLVWQEQGTGDIIMFLSLLPELFKLAPRICLAIEPRLQAIVNRSLPVETINIASTLECTSYDYQIPLASIAKFLRPTAASFKPHEKFINPDDNLVSKYKQMRIPGKKLVGISWRGGKERSAINRSLQLESLLPILQNPQYQIINLQHGNVKQELDSFQKQYNIQISQFAFDPKYELEEQLALIAALDMVVTVDNTNVHLAGALGVPTWLLLNFQCDWRWTYDRLDCIWYKSVKLLRQPCAEDWLSVIQELTTTLDQYSNS